MRVKKSVRKEIYNDKNFGKMRAAGKAPRNHHADFRAVGVVHRGFNSDGYGKAD